MTTKSFTSDIDLVKAIAQLETIPYSQLNAMVQEIEKEEGQAMYATLVGQGILKQHFTIPKKKIEYKMTQTI